MRDETEVIFMRVPAEEKQLARDLAEKCGLSLTGLWREMLTQMHAEPVITWRPVRRGAQQNVQQ